MIFSPIITIETHQYKWDNYANSVHWNFDMQWPITTLPLQRRTGTELWLDPANTCDFITNKLVVTTVTNPMCNTIPHLVMSYYFEVSMRVSASVKSSEWDTLWLNQVITFLRLKQIRQWSTKLDYLLGTSWITSWSSQSRCQEVNGFLQSEVLKNGRLYWQVSVNGKQMLPSLRCPEKISLIDFNESIH